MLPVIQTPKQISLVDLVIKAGFAKSKREARYFIESGAIRINGIKYINPETILEWSDEFYKDNG